MSTTQTQMNKLLGRFTKVLNIQDWNITLLVMSNKEYEIVHGKDFSYDTNGCTEIDEVNYAAKIFIKDSLSKEEAYETLLHECVHLVTNSYDSFVRNILTQVDTRKIRKQFTNEALWKMEINVSRFTTIAKELMNEK